MRGRSRWTSADPLAGARALPGARRRCRGRRRAGRGSQARSPPRRDGFMPSTARATRVRLLHRDSGPRRGPRAQGDGRGHRRPGGGPTQRFQIGAPPARSPARHSPRDDAPVRAGSTARRFGTAIELARNGVELGDGQPYLHGSSIVLRHTPRRALSRQNGGALQRGDTLASTTSRRRWRRSRRTARPSSHGRSRRCDRRAPARRRRCFASATLRSAVIRRRPVRRRSAEGLRQPAPSRGRPHATASRCWRSSRRRPGTAEAIDACVMRERADARADAICCARWVTRRGGHARDDAHLGRRRPGQYGRADGVDGRQLRDHRPGISHEQHDRRVDIAQNRRPEHASRPA
jgi:hypothetical protein